MYVRRFVRLTLASLLVTQSLLSESSPSAQAGDAQPPGLFSQSPTPGANGVSTAIAVKAIFDEAIQPATPLMMLPSIPAIPSSSRKRPTIPRHALPRWSPQMFSRVARHSPCRSAALAISPTTR